ncbi:hypothetical protein FRB94_012594 [Tulasnella sp. JGI-2019a]|nr:hypothetical protein FRB93_001443 [Tulasnella sp. JGI-2019a]KAG9009069.1 hypothetical protein FRB94_012594 [Tulasnella sp. JGI-2019a]
MPSFSNSSRDQNQQHDEIIPDSTSHDSILRRLTKSDCSDFDGQPSSPTQRLSSRPTLAVQSRSISHTKMMEDATERPQPRRRVAVTYGRKKDVALDVMETQEEDRTVIDVTDDVNGSRSTFGDAILPQEPSNKVATRSRLIDVDIGSDDDESDAGGDEASSGPSKFQFGFRKALAAVDQQYDEQDEAEKQNPKPAATRAGSASSPTRAPATSSTGRPARPSVDRGSDSDSGRDAALNQSSSTARHSSKPRPKKQQRRSIIVNSDSDEASPIRNTSPRHKRRSKKNDASPSSNMSPAPDRVFGSPALAEVTPSERLSSPPTSPDDEDEDQNASARVAAPDFTGETSRAKVKRRKGEEKASKEKAPKVRSLSKKIRLEMDKEQARIFADKPIVLPIPKEEQPRYSLGKFFQKLQGANIPGMKSQGSTSIVSGEISSDPIESSQSQPPEISGTCTTLANSIPTTPDASLGPTNDNNRSSSSPRTHTADTKTRRGAELGGNDDLMLDDNDADDPPSLDEYVARHDAEKRKTAAEQRDKARQDEKRRAFLQQKREYVAQQERQQQQQAKNAAPDDDDEELEIEATAVDPPPQTKSTFYLKPPPHHSTVSKTKPSTALPSRKSINKAEGSLATSKLMTAHRIVKVHKVDAADVMDQLRRDGMKQNTEARKSKEEEWVGRGGKTAKQKQIEDLERRKQGLDDVGGGVAAVEDELSKWVRKGVAVAEGMQQVEVEGDDGDDDNEEDGDFTPAEGDENSENENENDQGTSDKENANRATVSPSRRAAVGMENADHEAMHEEDQENAPVRAPLQSRSISPAPLTEDGNNEPEDKENVPPPSKRRRRVSLSDDDDVFSPRRRVTGENGDEDDEDLGGPILHSRAPFRSRRIVDDEDEENVDNQLGPALSVVSQGSVLARLGAALTFDDDPEDDTPLPRGRAPLAFGGGAVTKTALNQSQESLDFDMGDVGADEVDGFTQLFNLETNPAGFDALRRVVTLDDVDFESQKLLPAMNLSTQDLQKDDAIFEEDQLANAMLERQERRKSMVPKQYLNDDGFFTQTMPVATEHKQGFRLPFDSPGRPAGTQVFDSQFFKDVAPSQAETVLEDDLSQAGPFRRIVRGMVRDKDKDDSDDENVRPAPAAPKNAFQVLMEKKPKDPVKALQSKEKKKAINAAFVQGEAYESDEDVMQGFGTGARDDDDDDDDEEQNKVVEGLVDDAKMDASVENEEAVRAKAAEHAAAADAEDERVAKLAAEGKLRGKKRDRGIGLNDDSSDSEEDDDARRRRHAISKKRKINGDNLEALAKNPKTVPFYNTYQLGIAPDEDNDFGAGPSSDAVEADERVVDGDDDDDDGEDQDEEMDDEDARPRETVTAAQLRRELLEAVQNGETAIDPYDISWLPKDGSMLDDDDDPIDVTEVQIRKKIAPRTIGQANIDQEAVKEKFRLGNMADPSVSGSRAALASKAKGPAAYGPTKAGSAITGHAAAPKKATSSSTGGSAADKRKGRQAPMKSASMLSKVSKKGWFAE